MATKGFFPFPGLSSFNLETIDDPEGFDLSPIDPNSWGGECLPPAPVLPPEVLVPIMSALGRISAPTEAQREYIPREYPSKAYISVLQSCALVNRTWNDVATALLYTHVTIATDRSARSFARTIITSKNSLGGNVLSLHIDGRRMASQDEPERDVLTATKRPLPRPPRGWFLTAVVQHCRRLTSLDLEPVCDATELESSFWSATLFVDNLVHLSIHGGLTEYSSEWLLSALTSGRGMLKCLEELTLENIAFRSGALADCQWTAMPSCRHLRLKHVRGLEGVAFSAFLQNVASSLRILEIDGMELRGLNKLHNLSLRRLRASNHEVSPHRFIEAASRTLEELVLDERNVNWLDGHTFTYPFPSLGILELECPLHDLELLGALTAFSPVLHHLTLIDLGRTSLPVPSRLLTDLISLAKRLTTLVLINLSSKDNTQLSVGDALTQLMSVNCLHITWKLHFNALGATGANNAGNLNAGGIMPVIPLAGFYTKLPPNMTSIYISPVKAIWPLFEVELGVKTRYPLLNTLRAPVSGSRDARLRKLCDETGLLLERVADKM